MTLSEPLAAGTGERADRRSELAVAAYRLIASRGLSGLSVRRLAREAGGTAGLVTHHFLDRDEIVAAALEHAIGVMQRRTSAAKDPRAVLAAVLPTDPESIENWRFALAVRAAALGDPALWWFDDKIHQIWHEHLPVHLKEVSLPSDGSDPHDAVDYLVAVIDGVALRAVRDPDAWPEERQRRHTDRAVDALVTRPAPRQRLDTPA